MYWENLRGKSSQKQTNEKEKQTNNAMKHITLSADRPEATELGRVFLEYGNNTQEKLKNQHRYLRRLQGKYYIGAFVVKASKLKRKHRSDPVEDKTPAIGSDQYIYATKDLGFLETVLMAYNHHWNLRTSPEDWWYCVISRVARAIHENSKKESVRKMFVEHEGKKTLTVLVEETNIYDVDYTLFFDKMEKLIADNVKVPEYVDCVTADFSTTTPVQSIVSQVTLLSSLQEFFEYRLGIRCGIPAIEMLGTEEDWKKLLSKLKALRTVLEPIEKDLDLGEEWWSYLKEVFSKLVDTFHGLPDEDWWSRIISKERFGSQPDRYSGWLVKFLQGSNEVPEDKIQSGLISTPLTLFNRQMPITDEGKLVAGMIGYTVHDEATENKRVSVQPFHGWSLMLSKNSPFRSAGIERELDRNSAGHSSPKMMKMK